jgi:AmmeMemoRadiSam system protein A
MLDQQRQTLLRIAREAVEAAARGKPYTPQADDPALEEPGAAFVTLKHRGDLRGCIGSVEPREPLVSSVASMARAAAVEDPRFPPVGPTEVDDLTIEISVMSKPRPVANVREIEVGKHGLIAEQGGRRGLLLPQVPVEWGWTREEFLDHTCAKAGLPKDAWRGDARLYAFTAEVFGEEE